MAARKMHLSALAIAVLSGSQVARATPSTAYGDFDNDGKVTNADIAIIDHYYNLSLTDPSVISPAHGDANADGKINGRDYAILNANYGTNDGTAPHNLITPGSITVTTSIVSMQQSTDGVNYVTSTVNPTLNTGDFYRFGLAVQVTDTSTGLPTSIGLANIGYAIASNDPTGALFAPSHQPLQNFGLGSGVVLLNGDFSGGQVGMNSPIFMNELGADNESTNFRATADTIFTRLTFHASANGSVVLTPVMDLDASDLLADPASGYDPIGQLYADSLFAHNRPSALPSININIVPEPASVAVIGLSMLCAASRRRRT